MTELHPAGAVRCAPRDRGADQPGRPLDGTPGPARAGDHRDGPPVRGLQPTRVEGPICESTDSLGVHDLPPLRRGDLVAIADAGAYAASQSSTYNGRPRPPQVLLDPEGGARARAATARLSGPAGRLAEPPSAIVTP